MIKILNEEHRLTGRVRKYEGYPLEVAILNTEGATVSQDPESMTVEVDSNVPVSYTTRLPHHVLRIQEDAACTFVQASTASSVVTLDTLGTCLPDAPYYVRWVNTIGGYDYAMFGKERNTSDAVADRVAIQRDTTSTAGSQAMVSATASRTQTITLEGIDTDEFNRVSGVLRAPIVEAYATATGQWVPLVFAEDSTAVYNHNTTKQTLTLEVQEPRTLLQF